MEGGLPPNWDDWAKRFLDSLPRIPTDYLESVSRAADIARDNLAQIEKALASFVAPSVEAWRFQIPEIPRLPVDIRGQLADLARQWHEAWVAALPPNWAELEDDDAVFRIVDHVRESKVCLVWLPRATVLAEILGASPTDAKAILLAHRDEVLGDAVTLLDECAAPELVLERDATRDAIAALTADHYRAAQALAAAAFTSTCHVFFNHGGTGKIAQTMRETGPEDAAIAQLRLRTIFLTGGMAFKSFNPELAKPRFKYFNRHNTVHRITAEQFTEENALTGVVLGSALLRELENWQTVLRGGDAPHASA